uniref:DNA (cytosine-5-)-methyltransferase n=1 Tax=Scleropages formosus TaxID=113540 RepID=A0A8C9STV9_SCLFO
LACSPRLKCGLKCRIVKSSCEGRLCSTGVLRFIKKHWAGWEAAKTGSDGDRVPSHPERHVLGLGHLQGLASICTKTPYCVYLYCRVDLGGAKSADVILLGFFDVDAGKHLIRLLDVVQPEEDAAHTANSLIKTLKTSKIPTVKLAAFHVAGEDEFAEQVASHLKGLLPHAVSLVGLYSLSDRACRTIIETHSSLVKELVMELYHHYSSCSSTDDNLKELFGSVGVRPPVLSHCLVFCQIVCKILGMWSDLATYFKSCDPTDNRTKKISAHLENLHMKATVMFLSHALQPLCDFQEQLEKREGRREDLVHVLLEASDLLRSYAASFLHSSAAIKFLKERDISVLKSKKSHLPDAEVNVGVAVEDFLEEHKEALADMLPTFAEGAISFYVSVTAAVAESLPLNEGSLRNVSKLLSPSRVLKLTGKALLELGAEFCLRDIKRNATQLTNDLVHYQLELGKESSQDFQELVPCLEQHWSAALKAMPPTSILRTLVLTLLALPCPPLKAEKVFAQVRRSTYTCTAWCPQWYTGLSFFQSCFRMWHSYMSGVMANWVRLAFLVNRFRFQPVRLQDGKGFRVGELVWGKVKGFSWWPGIVVGWRSKSVPVAVRRVEWFGDGMFSEIYTECLLPFGAFTKCFCNNSFASLPTYKSAVFQALELAAMRSSKVFPPLTEEHQEDELKAMLDWAFDGFRPSGPQGFQPPPDPCGELLLFTVKGKNIEGKDLFIFNFCSWFPEVSFVLLHFIEVLHVALCVCVCVCVCLSRTDFCLSCGASNIEIFHPLFKGSLCLKCKDNFMETLYRYDEDGYQSYCTVCCAGLEVILCGNASCCRCYCKDCLNILVGPGTFEQLMEVDPWNCYMCVPPKRYGVLSCRPDWSVRVQEFFVNNSAMEFVRGLSCCYLVLKDLGFKVERYIASEICEDSIAVGMIKHEGKIEHVNDVRNITKKHIAEWGPFDLLIGGSPCNDLSMVNPARKGLYEGTGRLFFEYYRLLTLLRPREDEDRPFFWLFENVVAMSSRDKTDICRFLECNPVLIDAVKVSPAHRARYFWGNLPGMDRPLAVSQNDKVDLQDCLEVGRTAKFNKVRTITTKSNSIRQGKTGPLPVTMNGKDDYLWCTELERVFGFPKHYTDINNMGRCQRQKVLGRSWSVPVIRHLFAPLKDYFACE